MVFSATGLLIGEVGGGVGFEGFGAEEVHAVGGAGAGDDDEAGDVAGGGDARAFRGDEVVGLGGGLEARPELAKTSGYCLKSAERSRRRCSQAAAVD